MCVPLWPPLGKGGLFPILSHRLRSLDARAAKGKRTAWTPDPDVGEDLAPSRRRSTILQENSEANPHISADPPHFIDAIVPRAAGRGRDPPLRRKPHLLYLYRCFRYLAARFFYMFSSLFCLPQIRHRVFIFRYCFLRSEFYFVLKNPSHFTLHFTGNTRISIDFHCT